MENLIQSVKKSLQDSSDYAALFITLNIPDICGKVSQPNSSSKARYVNWFEDNISKLQRPYIYKSFLSGADMYALRCAILHEGSLNIELQRAKELLDYFVLVAGDGSHLNQFNNFNGNQKKFLQISVHKLCIDICEAAEKWVLSLNVQQQKKIQDLCTILPLGSVYEGIQFN